MSRRIVFGDIHGCYEEFIELINQIGITDKDEIISLGDIVDRGPKSVELFEYFSTRKNAKVIMGNHERKHLNGVLTYAQEIVKVQFGEKYEAFLDWLTTLDYYYETEEAIIIHAFFEHDKPLNQQKETVLCGSTSGTRYLEKKYGTDKYWSEFYDGKKPIIYGHHVVGEIVKILNNTYGIDTGACHSGMLTAIELPSFKIHQIKVKQDYWKTERLKWQIPVLKAKPWETMTFEQIERQISKLRYIENPEIQAFLDKKENWSLKIQAKIPILLEQIKAKANSILEEYGNERFNEIANQYAFKVLLFKARANRLTVTELRKSLNTVDKILELEKELNNNE